MKSIKNNTDNNKGINRDLQDHSIDHKDDVIPSLISEVLKNCGSRKSLVSKPVASLLKTFIFMEIKKTKSKNKK